MLENDDTIIDSVLNEDFEKIIDKPKLLELKSLWFVDKTSTFTESYIFI